MRIKTFFTGVALAGLTACASMPPATHPETERQDAMLTIITNAVPET